MIQIRRIDAKLFDEVRDFCCHWASEIIVRVDLVTGCFDLQFSSDVPVILTYNTQLHLELGSKDLFIEKNYFESFTLF